MDRDERVIAGLEDSLITARRRAETAEARVKAAERKHTMPYFGREAA